MFQPASTAPTDGRPVVWLHADGSGAYVLFVRHGVWWQLTDDYNVMDDVWCQPIEDIDDMKETDLVWADMPPAILAECMRFVFMMSDDIDKAKEAGRGYFRTSAETVATKSLPMRHESP